MTFHLAPEELQRLEPGRIVAVEGTRIRVKTDDAIVDLQCRGAIPDRLRGTSHLHPPTKYLSRYPEVSARLT